tara:strand:+ start:229 stop:1677 length:1449 start_codon:yes stop_codon:yes gene_type:complete
MRTQSVFWSQEKLDKVTESLLKGLSYNQVAKEMSKDYPNDVFTSEKIRHLKRHGKLDIPASRNLQTGYTKKDITDTPSLGDFEMEDNIGDKYGDNIEVIGNYAILDYRGKENPKTLNELLSSCNVDTEIWKVDRYVVNKWETAMKTQDAIVHRPLFQVKAWLVRIKPIEVDFPHVVPIAPVGFKKPKIIRKPHKALKKALIIPDAQFGFRRDINTGVLDPFHDRNAIDCVLQVAEKEKPDIIIYLGDMLDLPEWSDKFLVSPEFFFTTQPAINELYWWTSEFRKHCDKFVYIEGNHELRMSKAISKNIIAAYNLKPANEPRKVQMTIPTLLALDDLGVEYLGPYPSGEFWINDNLRVSHGTIAKKGNADTVKAILSQARNSEIVGHIHRHEMAQKTVHPRKGLRTYVAYSPGTVARIEPNIVPAFSARNDWQQGFAVVSYQDGDGLFQIAPYSIHEGVTLYAGEEIKARKPILKKLKKSLNL